MHAQTHTHTAGQKSTPGHSRLVGQTGVCAAAVQFTPRIYNSETPEV